MPVDLLRLLDELRAAQKNLTAAYAILYHEGTRKLELDRAVGKLQGCIDQLEVLIANGKAKV